MSERVGDVTFLLKAWQAGDQEAGERLMAVVYTELKKISSAYLKKERRDISLQATELVSMAYVKLVDQKNQNWTSRKFFFACAANLMRQILIEHQRKREALKRGGQSDGAVKLVLNEAIDVMDKRPLDLIRLDESLHELEAIDPQKSRLVELRFFAGMTIEETAAILKVSTATVKRDWALAKAWLARSMKSEAG